MFSCYFGKEVNWIHSGGHFDNTYVLNSHSTSKAICLLSWQPHLIPCFANLLMGVQRNDRTKENLCKMDGPGQGMETW